jgi:hypothetical protein
MSGIDCSKKLRYTGKFEVLSSAIEIDAIHHSWIRTSLLSTFPENSRPEVCGNARRVKCFLDVEPQPLHKNICSFHGFAFIRTCAFLILDKSHPSPPENLWIGLVSLILFARGWQALRGHAAETEEGNW